MNKIFTFIDRVTPKNNLLKLFVISFYTISLTFTFNIAITKIVGIDINFDPNSTIKKIQENIYLYFLTLVIITPLIETTIFQWLPLKLYKHFQKTKKYEYIFLLITGLIFGIVHSYSVGYQIALTFTGLILMILSMYYSENNKNYFFPIYLIHLLNNLIVFFIQVDNFK
jgi:hypothetical protein